MSVQAAPSLSMQAVFDAVGYKPHSGQVPIHKSVARNRVVAGGRRIGKSQTGGHELTVEAMLTAGMLNELEERNVRREFWIVGPEYSDSEKEFRVVYNDMTRLGIPFDRPGTYYNAVGGSLHISAFGGKFLVNGMSAKYPDSLVGEGLSGVILSEAAKLKERIWIKYIRPTLADFNGWAFMGSTPEGRNWFWEMWKKGQDPNQPNWDSWRMPSWTNPHVYRRFTDPDAVKLLLTMKAEGDRITPAMLDAMPIDPEIAGMALDMPETAFKQEIGADFTEYVGQVFKDWDDEVHVADLEFQRGWETYAAVDYGYTNPSVWLLLQVGPWGEVHVLKEYYERNRTPEEMAEDILARDLVPSSLLRFYPDPASPGDSATLSTKIRKPYAHSGTGGTIKDRIDMIRKALKQSPLHVPEGHPDRKPKLLVDRSCVETIREFNDYRYPATASERPTGNNNSPENPMKKDDHTPEALGRFFMGYYGPTYLKQNGTTVRESNLSW